MLFAELCPVADLLRLSICCCESECTSAGKRKSDHERYSSSGVRTLQVESQLRCGVWGDQPRSFLLAEDWRWSHTRYVRSFLLLVVVHLAASSMKATRTSSNESTMDSSTHRLARRRSVGFSPVSSTGFEKEWF